MNLTSTKAKNVAKAFKNGLSITLALIILSHATQPFTVLAASEEVGSQTVTSQGSTDMISTEGVAVAPEAQEPSTVQDILLKTCEANSKIIDTESCAKNLLGILMQESKGKPNARGDYDVVSKKYMAFGWFQINRHYNPSVSVSCADSLECSSTWTLNNLVQNGYTRSAGWNKWAIWCHNGCGISKTYVQQVLYKGESNWDQPIALATNEVALAINK